MSRRTTGNSPKQHTDEEWTVVQPTIINLYVAQRMKLRDVMTTMEAVHGFRATYELPAIFLAIA